MKLKNLILALMAALLVFGCGKKQEAAKKIIRIGVSIPAATHGWAGGVVWAAEQTQKKYKGTDVEIIFATASNPTEQANSKNANFFMANLRSTFFTK